MVCLYVTSPDEAGGKTALCAGIGQYLLENGRSVGYLKPTANGMSPDVPFMKHILALETSEDVLCPSPGKIKEAYALVAEGKGVVLVEGATGDADSGLLDALDARVMVVIGYATDLPVAAIVDNGKKYGKRLLGVVVNKVPQKRLELVGEQLSAQLAEAGIAYLGSLPESRALSGLTVSELSEHLQGELLNAPEKPVELVENIMLGAMVVGSGVDYFERKTNKAAVIRGERPDMQLAALETSTRCLVSTGMADPSEVVMHRAEEKEVPVIIARESTGAVVEAMEAAMNQARFRQEKKLPIITGMIKEALDVKALSQGLGLAG
ncbi:DRTGG domain-containing protein [Chloroflexota bacterium]